MLMSWVAQYWRMDFYSRVCDQRLPIIGNIMNQILMGQTRERSVELTDQEEEDRHAAGYTNLDIPKKESYLPGSAHGSPRHMAALARRALMLVSEWDCPHVFLMLTCNWRWPEILSQLHDGQTAFNRPDVTTAVFKSRLDLMKKNIRNGKYFGGREITYTFHVIEYQFCGLSHAHIVLRMVDAPDIEDKNGEEFISFVNKYFIAEMPPFEGDKHQNIYHEENSPAYTDAYRRKSVKLVCMNNMHQCSTAINGYKKNDGYQCKCGYSHKDTIPETFVDNVTNRVVYQRRLICDLNIVLSSKLGKKSIASSDMSCRWQR
jgi:hypothetical protein